MSQGAAVERSGFAAAVHLGKLRPGEALAFTRSKDRIPNAAQEICRVKRSIGGRGRRYARSLDQVYPVGISQIGLGLSPARVEPVVDSFTGAAEYFGDLAGIIAVKEPQDEHAADF